MNYIVLNGNQMSGFTSAVLMCSCMRTTASVFLVILDVVIMRIKSERVIG